MKKDKTSKGVLSFFYIFNCKLHSNSIYFVNSKTYNITKTLFFLGLCNTCYEQLDETSAYVYCFTYVKKIINTFNFDKQKK